MVSVGGWTRAYSATLEQIITCSLLRVFVFKSEEPPSALLLAHSALLSLRRRCKRRAAMLYVLAGGRLEKSGIVSSVTHRKVGTG
jgi:hypothetical protein